MHIYDLYMNCCKGAVNITRKDYRYICNCIRELKNRNLKKKTLTFLFTFYILYKTRLILYRPRTVLKLTSELSTPLFKSYKTHFILYAPQYVSVKLDLYLTRHCIYCI